MGWIWVMSGGVGSGIKKPNLLPFLMKEYGKWWFLCVKKEKTI